MAFFRALNSSGVSPSIFLMQPEIRLTSKIIDSRIALLRIFITLLCEYRPIFDFGLSLDPQDLVVPVFFQPAVCVLGDGSVGSPDARSIPTPDQPGCPRALPGSGDIGVGAGLVFPAGRDQNATFAVFEE